MSFFANEWILIPLLAIAAGVLVYQIADPVMAFLYKQSLGSRDEVIRYMRLMSGSVDERKVTWMMLSMSFGFGALFFLLFWPKVIVGLVFGISVTVAGWKLPLFLVRFMYESRCTKFVDQMVDGLTIMANGVKSGSNAPQAMSRVVEIMGNPISQEFKHVLTQVQFGQSFEDALTELGQRIPRPDVQMFVTSVNILKETGGNLAETFQTIVLVVRERQKVEKKIQAMTAQGLMQGIIISLVPFVMAGIFYAVDPQFIQPMFSTTLGWILCFVILVLQIIGGIVIKKIVTIKV